MFKTQGNNSRGVNWKMARIEIIRLQNIVGNIMDYIKVVERLL